MKPYCPHCHVAKIPQQSKDADFVEVVVSVVWFPYGRDTDGVGTDLSEVEEIEIWLCIRYRSYVLMEIE